MTDVSVDFDNLLLQGLGQILADAAIGEYHSDPAVPYTTNLPPIVEEELPSAPDAAIAIGTYVISDDPALADSVVAVQIFSRGAPQSTSQPKQISAAIFNIVHGMHDTDLPSGVHVVSAERRSGALLGKDDLSRWERVDNYYLTVWRPGPNRL